MCKNVVCFDLDDTLYKEIDFLKSGYRIVAELVEKQYGISSVDAYGRLLDWYNKGENPFANLNEHYGISNQISDYLNVYRYHHPNISLTQGVSETLDALKEAGCELAIITDGREITQKKKFEALGLGRWIPQGNIFINEDRKYFKPNHRSFDRLMLACYERCPDTELKFYYIGDNTEKDFLAPNELGWVTICLEDDGRNVHKQDFDVEGKYLPKQRIRSIVELLDLVIVKK